VLRRHLEALYKNVHQDDAAILSQWTNQSPERAHGDSPVQRPGYESIINSISRDLDGRA
jgi:hypothetical protein